MNLLIIKMMKKINIKMEKKNMKNILKKLMKIIKNWKTV